MIVVSTGCPSGVGPEVSVEAAFKIKGAPRILVGDAATIRDAAGRVGVDAARLRDYDGAARNNAVYVLHAGPKLGQRDRKPGAPSRAAGVAQLEYIDVAYRLVKAGPGRALVTGPVSKAAIAGSGARGARRFRGHTEHLQRLDGAARAVMCFWSPSLVTSLVTTHLALSRVPRSLTAEGVRDATVELARLLVRLGADRPRIAVVSLNPHAGESELFGREEARAIVPGIRQARRRLGKTATVIGPVGAETAYRLNRRGDYDGVVAMYHDQATIPTKLVAFGEAVNVTLGLSIVRTSVDHGTGYDIAWRKPADASGMVAAMKLAQRLIETRGPAISR